jgi:transcriptional regulator with XRE-family HTH domain
MDNKKLLGKRIIELRRQASYTQEQLAELIKIETSSLSGTESGRHFPIMPRVERIANVLNVELKSLFDFNHLQTSEMMKKEIINNIDKFDENKISIIYRLYQSLK